MKKINVILCLCTIGLLMGCGKPNYSNITSNPSGLSLEWTDQGMLNRTHYTKTPAKEHCYTARVKWPDGKWSDFKRCQMFGVGSLHFDYQTEGSKYSVPKNRVKPQKKANYNNNSKCLDVSSSQVALYISCPTGRYTIENPPQVNYWMDLVSRQKFSSKSEALAYYRDICGCN